MECYYHIGKNAVGICKSCQRGLCRDCAKEVTNGIACVDRCESAAELLNKLIQEAPGMNAMALSLHDESSVLVKSVSIYTIGTTTCVLGGIFIAFGVHQDIYLLTTMGIVFLLFGAFDFYRAWKAKHSAHGNS